MTTSPPEDIQSSPLNKEVNEKGKDNSPTASRKDLQLPRRFFHMGMGITTATIYYLFLGQPTAIYILGAVGSFLYLLDQIRINYPEMANKTLWLNRYLIRAEEKLKESAAIPYSMGLILTIFTFPKSVAVSAIYTLAIADPLSAIIGIRYGKNRIVPHKSIEGSLAFFFGAFFSVMIVFLPLNYQVPGMVLGMALFTALFTTSFEMMPLRLDDNITIPLFTGMILWIICVILDLPTA